LLKGGDVKGHNPNVGQEGVLLEHDQITIFLVAQWWRAESKEERKKKKKKERERRKNLKEKRLLAEELFGWPLSENRELLPHQSDLATPPPGTGRRSHVGQQFGEIQDRALEALLHKDQVLPCQGLDCRHKVGPEADIRLAKPE